MLLRKAPVVPHPEDLFSADRRHLVVLAHQDDELPNAGIIARMGGNVRIVWLTNGDGLVHESTDTPERYGERRTDESIDACAHLGLDRDRLAFLGHSELRIYSLLAALSRRADAVDVPPLFPEIARQVFAEAMEFEPEVVWTMAYQGGHPEHDLAHLCAAKAARELSLPLYELPAYELTFLVPLRFPPWRREPYHEILLSEDEQAKQQAMFESYPTQERILNEFRTLITLYGRVSMLWGRRFAFEDYARRAVFGPVPADRDYRRSSHSVEALDYVFDSYEGTPIRFGRTLPRIAGALGLH